MEKKIDNQRTDFPFAPYRSLFPVLANNTYLANCSQGALAKPVSNAIHLYQHMLLETGRNWEQSLAKLEKTREKFAQFIGADPDEIAILTSVSDAIAAIASTLPSHKTKKKIVFTDLDFPTVSHIWFAQDHLKGHLSIIPSINGEIHLDQYEKEITDETFLTCVSHVAHTNGFKQNLKEISEIVHRKGSLLFVDAYQSAGQIPINVKEMGIDMLATGTRKFMLGIPGVAFLYVKKDVAEQLKPRLTGWFGQEKSGASNHIYPSYAAGARRFQTGTPAFISIFAAYESIKLLQEVGIANICAYVTELGQITRTFALEKGLKVIGPLSSENSSAITSIYVEDVQMVEERLKDRRITIAPGNNVVRIAPHFYNTSDEIRFAINELAKMMGL